ncbi:glycosyltransferase [Rosenbergiella australiborealis]|uniref:glycosyltransferase n=1 Tax=Rosenbergiella australiborealis TaxID=1544696 RepID=UPI001F4ECB12|nr:glycosyltransferase [Rosenbergiella australiborealis]
MNITALIVTWNRLSQLKKSVKATLALPFQHVVIVNNSSTDGTKNWLEELDDTRIHLIHADNNLGGSEGFYLGSEYIANYLITDWVVFYDDDAWPAANFFEVFKKISTHNVAIICSKVIDCQGNICRMNLPWRKRTVSLIDNILYMIGDSSFVVDDSCINEVISCSFVGSIINANILKVTYSLIHRQLFIYYDDVYYGYHLYLLGYTLHYHPEIIMYHDIGQREKNIIAHWKIYYLVRNMFLARHIFKNNPFFTNSAILVRLIKYSILVLKAPKKAEGVLTLLKAIKDGIMNKYTHFKR